VCLCICRYRYSKRLQDGVGAVDITPFSIDPHPNTSVTSEGYVCVDTKTDPNPHGNSSNNSLAHARTPAPIVRKPCVLLACVYANNLAPVLGMSSVEANVYVETLRTNGNASSTASTQVNSPLFCVECSHSYRAYLLDAV
jgi:hypothetical protein